MNVTTNTSNNWQLVQAVDPYEPKPVSRDTYPWINAETKEVPSVLVTLIDGTTFQYGSIVGLNGAITRIADKVSERDSGSTQKAMFMGLPSVLKGTPHNGIRKVETSRLIGSTLFVASRNLLQLPSVVFGIEASNDENVPHSVLRAGSSHPNDLDSLVRIMGARPLGGRGRRS